MVSFDPPLASRVSVGRLEGYATCLWFRAKGKGNEWEEERSKGIPGEAGRGKQGVSRNCLFGEGALGVDEGLAATLAAVGTAERLVEEVARLARVDEALARLASDTLGALDSSYYGHESSVTVVWYVKGKRTYCNPRLDPSRRSHRTTGARSRCRDTRRCPCAGSCKASARQCMYQATYLRTLDLHRAGSLAGRAEETRVEALPRFLGDHALDVLDDLGCLVRRRVVQRRRLRLGSGGGVRATGLHRRGRVTSGGGGRGVLARGRGVRTLRGTVIRLDSVGGSVSVLRSSVEWLGRVGRRVSVLRSSVPRLLGVGRGVRILGGTVPGLGGRSSFDVAALVVRLGGARLGGPSRRRFVGLSAVGRGGVSTLRRAVIRLGSVRTLRRLAFAGVNSGRDGGIVGTLDDCEVRNAEGRATRS